MSSPSSYALTSSCPGSGSMCWRACSVKCGYSSANSPRVKRASDVLELIRVDSPVREHLGRVSEDVALDDVVRVIRQLLREARVAEAARVGGLRSAVAPSRVSRSSGGRPPRDGGGTPRGPRWRSPGPGLATPRRSGGSDLGVRRIDHSVEHVVLVRDVVVQRHRLDAELVGDLPHADRFDSALVASSSAARSTRSLVNGVLVCVIVLTSLRRTSRLTP